MITTGIIKGKFVDKDNVTLYNVDISIFRDPTSDRGQSVVASTCCATPGQYEAYNVDDVVYVSFINNSISHPVILGKIYQNLAEAKALNTASYFKVNSLEVTGETTLPYNTKIGDINFVDLRGSLLDLQNVASYITTINDKLKDVDDKINNISSDGNLATKNYAKSLLHPVLVGDTLCTNASLTFELPYEDIKGLYILEFGNTTTWLMLNNVDYNVEYRCASVFASNEYEGSEYPATLCYQVYNSGNHTYLEMYSGSSELSFRDSTTGYLYRIKLY